MSAALPRRLWLGAALLLLLPAVAPAQGLGDAAAREKQRRQAAPAKKEPVRVITNDDLRKEEAGKPASGTSASGASPTYSPSDRENARGAENASGEPGERDEEESPRQSEQRGADERVAQARQQVVAAEQRVEELQAKLNPMSPSFIYANPNNADAANEEIRTRQALTAAQGELAQAREGLVRANQDKERVERGLPARPEER